MNIEEIEDIKDEADSYRNWFQSGWERHRGSIDEIIEHSRKLSECLKQSLSTIKSLQTERDKYREAMEVAIYELGHLRKAFPELPDHAFVARTILTIKRDLESALKEE